jgi:predicted acetyltransferase
VPQWTYVLVENPTTVVGEIRYRPSTAPPFRPGHDHIGYNMRPSYRRRGYASMMLGQVLDRARAEGIPGVALIVEGHNPGSVRTIAKHGGTLAEQYTNEHGTLVSIHWIALP